MTEESRALVLDFGGVITRTLFETHPMTEKVLGLPSGSLTWRGPFEPDSDPLWVAMQNGELTEREYWTTRTQEVGEMVGESWTEMSQFLMAARGDDPEPIIRPEALTAFDEAREAGAQLAILSNELDLFYGKGFAQKLSFIKYFEIVVDATYTHILKPDPRAYRACVQQLDLPPEKCVFVDDQRRNVVGAQRVGMQTVLFDVQQPQKSFRQALDLLWGE